MALRSVCVVLCDFTGCLSKKIDIDKVKNSLLKEGFINKIEVISSICKDSNINMKKPDTDTVLFVGCPYILKNNIFKNLAIDWDFGDFDYYIFDILTKVFNLYKDPSAMLKVLNRYLLAYSLLLSETEILRKTQIEPDEKILLYGSGYSGLFCADKIKANFPVDIVKTPNELLSPGFFAENYDNPEELENIYNRVQGKGKVEFLSQEKIIGISRDNKGFLVKMHGEAIRKYGAILFLPEKVEEDCKDTGAFNLTQLYDLIRNDRVVSGTIIFILDYYKEIGPVSYRDIIHASLIIKKGYKAEIYILAKNIQVCMTGGQELYNLAREAGIVFIKYNDNLRLKNDQGEFCIQGYDPQTKTDFIFEKPDMVVLPQRSVISDYSVRFAHFLGFSLPGGNKYSQADSLWILPNFTDRVGIFTGGSSRENLDPESIKADLESTLFCLYEYLENGGTSVEEHIPVVDDEKCAYCLTCIRLCPFGAMTKDDENRIAKVVESACKACGVCVSECPAEALQMRNLKNNTLYKCARELVR